MKLLCTLAAAVAALTLTASASARTTTHHRWATMTTTERRAVVVREIRVQRAPLRWWLRARSRTLFASTRFPLCAAVGVRAPDGVCRHARRLVRALGVLRRIDARLAARANARRLAELAARHYAGWSCITNGRHPGVPGDPHEGNSSSGTYTGPLQMTYPWAGYYVRWYDVPVSTVYAIAESVAARHGFSYSWMQGQWPNTYPPCADFFR